MNGSIHGSPAKETNDWRFQHQISHNPDIPSLEPHHDPYDEEMGGGGMKKKAPGEQSCVF